MNIEKLEEFLKKTNIPKIKSQQKTFLGIAKQPHYENVISNIYSFYFNPIEDHQLGSLFIDTFITLISDKTDEAMSPPSFEVFDIYTEYPTDKNGRIDLLLQNDQDVIIIENKIYHFLANDLNDYYNTLQNKGYKKGNIFGVVLSLYPMIKIDHSQFISITHKEFLNKVVNKIRGTKPDLNQKYIVFLLDFHQNLLNMTENQITNEHLTFYLDHSSEIERITELKSKVYDHLFEQIERAVDAFSDLKLYPARRGTNHFHYLRYFVGHNSEDLSMTIVLSKTKTGSFKLLIFIELSGKLKSKAEEVRSIESQINELIKIQSGFYTSSHSYTHLVKKEYLLNEENLIDLTSFIVDKISKDHIHTIFKMLEKLFELGYKKS